MVKKNRAKAQRMAARGVSAAKIERKTDVSSRAAERFVSRAAAPSSRTSAVQTNAGPDPMGSPTPEIKGVKQGLRIAGEGGISGGELKTIREATGMSDDKLIRKLDKVNKKLKGQDKTGISINAGAVNKIIKQGIKQRAKDPFGVTDFGTGRLGMTIAGMMGDFGSAGRYVKGQLIGAREAVEPTLLGGGKQLRPGGRDRNIGFGKQYELPEKFKPQDPIVKDPGPPPPPGAGAGAGDGVSDGDTNPVEPVAPGSTVDTSQITEANPFDLASWATGYRRARSTRQRAGRRAQGLASQKKAPFKSWNQ